MPHFQLPGLAACLAANLAVARLTSPAVQAVGIALNTVKLDEDEALRLCADTGAAIGLPCTDPFRFSADPIVDRMLQCFAPSTPSISAST